MTPKDHVSRKVRQAPQRTLNDHLLSETGSYSMPLPSVQHILPENSSSSLQYINLVMLTDKTNDLSYTNLGLNSQHGRMIIGSKINVEFLKIKK